MRRDRCAPAGDVRPRSYGGLQMALLRDRFARKQASFRAAGSDGGGGGLASVDGVPVDHLAGRAVMSARISSLRGMARDASPGDAMGSHSKQQDVAMSTNRYSEVLFIDPGVDDVATLRAGVRPGVEPIVLEAGRSAARQMAEALVGRRGLDAVHVVAHGAPGCVAFGGGAWSASAVEAEAGAFAAIGAALGEGGGLRLWSCHAGAGAAGEALVAGLRAAVGGEVAAAEGLVGAAGLGGSWELGGVEAPLTVEAVGAYAGVLITLTWAGPSGTTTSPTSGNWNTATNWSGSPQRVPLAGDTVVIGVGETSGSLAMPSYSRWTLRLLPPQ